METFNGMQYQCKWSNCYLFANQYLFQRSFLSYMKHSQKVSLVGFTSSEDPTWTLVGNVFMYEKSKMLNLFQWVFLIFPLSEIGDCSGINTDLQIDPNSIPYPEYEPEILSNARVHPYLLTKRLRACVIMNCFETLFNKVKSFSPLKCWN